MFKVKVVEKIKTHIFDSITFFHEPCRSLDNAENYGRAGQPIEDNINVVPRMGCACCL